MKKRFLSFFLALSILTTMVIMPVSGSETGADTTALSEACPCGCGLSLDQVTWEVFDPNTAGGVFSGHYYLAEDYVQTVQHTIGADNRIVLDLRGCTLTTKNYTRLYLINGYMAVLDTVGGGKMCAKTGGNAYGGVIMMSYSDTDGATKPVFELHSGILTADKDNLGGRRGGLLSVGSSCEFRMYGGMILNGTSQGEKAEAGGCIAATSASSIVRIEGGVIVGGYAPSHGGNIYSNGGTTVLKNCEIIGGKSDANGGNIYQTGGSLTMENCTVTGGSAGGSYGGGNICAQSGAVVEIRDCIIRNGYAAKQGGNIYFATGTQEMENTTLEAGVCGTYGGNLRMTANAVTTLRDCVISGDVSASGTLTLQGAMKIGLLNNGLNLVRSGETKAVSAAGLTEGAEIYVNAGALFTDAGANAAYFKPALRTVITETAEGLVGAQTADGESGGYCPHCGEQVIWQAFSVTGSLVEECYLDSSSDTDSACTGRHIATGHYYLTESYTTFSQMYAGAMQGDVMAAADVVIDLNGCSITAAGRPFYLKPTTPVSTLTLLDSVGGSVVTGKGVTNQGGGLIYSEKGNVNIYGGQYVYATGKTVRSGGILLCGNTTNIYGGIFDGTAYSQTGYTGGVLYQPSGTTRKLTVTAGYFAGGSAKNGGVLYLSSNSSAHITGGQFVGGSAVNAGGSIHAAGSATSANGSLRISGAVITDGHADTYAGNLHATYFDTYVENTYIARGSSDDYAGNIHLGSNADYASYQNCIITDGTAKRGANLYSSGIASRSRFTDCLIIGGTATGSHGGNLSAVNGYIEIVGGMITGGSAETSGGNIYATLGNNESAPDNNLLLTGGVQITDGSATDGGNLYFGGVVNLENAFINNGKAEDRGQDICMVEGSNQTVLTVGEKSTGSVEMYIEEALMGSPVYGSTVAGTVATALNMVITLEGDYGQPRLCVSDGALAVSAASVEGGGSKWYATAAEAAEACEEGEYIKLFSDAALELSKDCTVDLNGNTLTVTGDYILSGMDSSGDSLTVPTGKVQGDVQIPEYCRSADNRLYVAVTENGETTFHRLDMKITGAALRPSVSGIYYTGAWGYDEVLAEKLTAAGVAVSAVAMPNENFMEENSACLWTSFDASSMVSGENKTGAIISGILSEDRTAELNDAYGKMPVFATAYVTLSSGTTVTSDDPNHQNDVGYSVYSLMQQLEALTEVDPNTYSRYLLPARGFYEKWLDSGMGEWAFSKIPGKADNGKLDILFIGNSFTWYGKCVLDKGQNAWALDNRVNDQGYFYQVCKANGVEANVTNFTFGGHQLSDWYSSNCQANRGHNGLDHMAYLTDRDYDYVVLQQGSAGSDLADILAECQPLMDVFREVNPDTKFVFLVHHRVHQTNSSYKTNLKTLEEAGLIVVDWGALVADVIDGTTAVPGATVEYSQNSFVIRKSESDGYHENMLGGYITAQMLYCAITGESAVGQDYSFCGDTSINKAFDFEKFLKEEYVYDPGNSNFIEIFNSESDMLGLQQLIDKYLAEKAYRNY